MEKLGIIGCGWLGSKIAEAASDRFEIYCTTTSADKIAEFESKNFHPTEIEFSDSKEQHYDSIFSDFQAIIITVPFSQRTSVEVLQTRFNNIINFIGDFKGQLFLCSSTGIYPQSGEILSENSLPENFLNESIWSIEKLMRQTFPQINVLRFGGLMGADRIFSKYYLNKSIAEPNQYVNHTHYEDICAVILNLIKLKTRGETFNVVAPEHPTKIEVFNCQTEEVCTGSSAVKSGKRITSEKLIKAINYHFIHPDPRQF